MNKGTPADPLRQALAKAFSLGQTYWRLADSDSYADNKRSDATLAKYREFVEETCAALATKPAETPTAERLRAQGINPETFLPRHPTESAGKAVQRPVITRWCNKCGYSGPNEDHARPMDGARCHYLAARTDWQDTQRSSNANGSDDETSPTVQPPAPKPLTCPQCGSAHVLLEPRTQITCRDCQDVFLSEAGATPSIAQRGAALTDEQIHKLWLKDGPSARSGSILKFARELIALALSPERPE